MANNYTSFSFAIELEDDEQRDWAQRAVAYVSEYAERLAEASGLHEVRPDEDPEHEFADLLPDDDWMGFDVHVDDRSLWIYTEESGQPEHVVPLVQAFLRRFKPDGAIGLEWADTCSKPRLNEFGGGAVFVTANDEKWMASSSWLAEQMKTHGEGGT